MAAAGIGSAPAFMEDDDDDDDDDDDPWQTFNFTELWTQLSSRSRPRGMSLLPVEPPPPAPLTYSAEKSIRNANQN